MKKKYTYIKTPEQKTLSYMKSRCCCKGSTYYHRYGGRGIKVCDRWLHSVDNFVADVGKKPGPDYSIDRINNDGNYEPGNCRWATRKEQALNQSKKSKIILIGGRKKTAVECQMLHGVQSYNILNRIKRGWKPEDAIKTPVRIIHRKPQVFPDEIIRDEEVEFLTDKIIHFSDINQIASRNLFAENPLLNITSRETRDLIRDAVLLLPSFNRDLMFLLFWDGLTITEVSKKLGCSKNNIRAHKSKTLSKLRKLKEIERIANAR